MKKLLALILVFTMLLSVVACNNANKPSDPNNQGNQGNQNGKPNNNDNEPSGELDAEQYYNTYLSSDPTSLDISLRSDSYSSTIIINVMEGLIRREDRNGDYVIAPGDATKWESNEEGTVWTFHLGDNKWSDGVPVTAEQYVYSLVRSADPATGCPNSFFLSPILNYDAISKGEMDPSELGVKALDEKTLEITLSQVVPAFLEMCDSTIYYPQREDKMQEWGEKYGTEAQYTMYNGPFVIDSWTHNSSIVLKKNPNYWNADNVKMQKVNLAIMSDTNTIINAYKSGDLDTIGVSTQEWLEEFQKDSASKYVNYATQAILFTFYNTQDDLMKNEKIRKALNLAIDHEDINEMCFGGLRIPVWGWVVPTISVGETNFREAAGDVLLEQLDQLTAKGQTPKDLLIEGMKEAGLGDDPSTLNITLSLAGTDDWFRTFGEYIQQVYLTDLGVNLKINFADWAIFYENVQNGNYQMAYMSWGAYYNDPFDVLSIFKSNLDQVETGWGNPEFDRLVDEANVEMDEQKRLEKYIAAERILLEEAVACPLLSSTVHSFYKNYVHGYSTLGFSSNGYKDMYTTGR